MAKKTGREVVEDREIVAGRRIGPTRIGQFRKAMEKSVPDIRHAGLAFDAYDRTPFEIGRG